MDLREFLKVKRLKRKEFSQYTGIPIHKVDHILNKGRPTLKTAVIIEDFTSIFENDGSDEDMVTVRDLLTKEESKDVDRLWDKFKRMKT